MACFGFIFRAGILAYIHSISRSWIHIRWGFQINRYAYHGLKNVINIIKHNYTKNFLCCAIEPFFLVMIKVCMKIQKKGYEKTRYWLHYLLYSFFSWIRYFLIIIQVFVGCMKPVRVGNTSQMRNFEKSSFIYLKENSYSSFPFLLFFYYMWRLKKAE